MATAAGRLDRANKLEMVHYVSTIYT